MQSVLIGTDEVGVTITVIQRKYPQATDYWDGNWVDAEVKVHIRPWAATYSAALRCDEFLRFREEVERMNASLTGRAEFQPLEPWLSLQLTLDPLGHITLKGKAAPEAPGRVFGEVGLQFTVREALDQTLLAPLIEQLLAVEAEFPVIGQ